MRKCILGFLLALLSLPALGDSLLPSDGLAGGSGTASSTITLCSAEAGTGICDDGSSVDYRAHISNYSLLTFTTAGSTGSYRCQIYQSPLVINVSDVDLTGDGTVATRFDLSNTTQESVTLVAGFGTVWLDCTSNTGSVTATVRAQG